MRIELDVFSGRPNPRWELDESQSRELLQIQERLELSRSESAQPPALGYRGFLYSDASGPVRAYRGHVKTRDALYADPSLRTEHYLLERLPAQYATLRARIASELTTVG